MLKHVTQDKAEYYASSTDGAIVSTGRLSPGNHVWGAAANNVIAEQNENEYLSQINAIGPVPDDLPPMGTPLEAGIVYAWNGQNVIVRQDHTRTEHDPDTVPALFLFYRADYGGLEWIANERVAVGDRRSFEEILYECGIGHVTAVGQQPPLTPNLWSVVREDWDEWAQPLSTNPYMKGDKVTHNGQRWISDIDVNVWAPGVYGWAVQPDG